MLTNKQLQAKRNRKEAKRKIKRLKQKNITATEKKHKKLRLIRTTAMKIIMNYQVLREKYFNNLVKNQETVNLT